MRGAPAPARVSAMHRERNGIRLTSVNVDWLRHATLVEGGPISLGDARPRIQTGGNHVQSRQGYRSALGIAEKLGGRRGNAVKEAQKSLRDVKSIYIKDLSAEVDNGKIVNFRITAKLSFKLE